MTLLRGTYTAVVTPFDPQGRVDADGLRENIRFQLDNGIDGILALGTTGEAPTLSYEEKKQVIAITVEEVKGKALVMVGTGSYSTQQAILQTQEAKYAGADLAVVVAPYYNKPTQEGLYLHYKAIAETAKLPVMIYNHQGRTGQNIQTDTLKRLADIPGIVGVKETSGNVSQISEVIEQIARHRPDFTVLSGDDPLTFMTMALGGHGVLSVVANIIPAAIRSLVKAMQEGDFEQGREIHFNLMPFFRAAFIETNPIPVKTMMALCGMPAGGCRLPLCALQPGNLEIVKNVIQQYKSILPQNQYTV